MRILFLTHYTDLYGANRALLTLLSGLKKEGKHEPILVLPAEGELSELLRGEGIECFICGVTQWQAIYRGPVSFEVKKFIRRRRIEAEVRTLEEHFRDRGIDLIHSNSSVIGTGAMLAEKLGCMHVWHIREFAREHYGMRYFYPAEKVRHYYEQADQLVTISDELKEHYRSLYPGARVLRIYDGVEGFGEPAEKEETSTVRFCYVGYLFPKKNQLDLLEAAAELKEEGIGDFRVILAGEGDAAYRKKLEELISFRGLSEAELAGFVRDVPALLKTCDVGVIASEHEGFGLVTVEYMLAGLPVIGRESGATPEIVLDGETGLLYRDRKGLKKAMRELIEDAGKRKALGKAGYQRALGCFSAEANLAAVRKLYECLEGGSADERS